METKWYLTFDCIAIRFGGEPKINGIKIKKGFNKISLPNYDPSETPMEILTCQIYARVENISIVGESSLTLYTLPNP
jgi:hypothetical protein